MHLDGMPMRTLSKRDRSLLGSLVVAMIVGVGGSLALAASCLGRDRAQRDDTAARFPDDESARTSAGGVPGEQANEVTGTTRITAAELPPAGAAAATTNAPPAEPSTTAPPPAPHTNTIETTPRPAPAATPAPSPAPTSAPTANTSTISEAGAAVDSGTEDAGGPASATRARDGGTTSATPAPPPQAPIGAGSFVTEPTNPYGASSWTSNPEAGAGRFSNE